MSARQAARWKRAACPALARDSFSKSKIWGRNRGFGMHFGELRLSKPLREGAGERPGDMRRGVRGGAFLAPQGRSKRLRGAGCGDGAGARRERWARRRACRGRSGRTRRSFRRGGDAWRGVMRRCLPQAAFLAHEGARNARAVRPPFAAKTAHATASVGWVWDPPVSERRPSPYRAQRGRPLTAAERAYQHERSTKTPCSN